MGWFKCAQCQHSVPLSARKHLSALLTLRFPRQRRHVQIMLPVIGDVAGRRSPIEVSTCVKNIYLKLSSSAAKD